MSRLDKAINKLKKLTQYEDVVVICEQLQDINKKKFNGDVVLLRELLNTLLKERKALCSQAAVDGLLALAKIYPKNERDPISNEPIASI